MKAITILLLAATLTTSSFAQPANDTTGRFYDDLIDHLVGKWEVNATVYGQKFTLDREAEWVMNHQYLRIYEKSRDPASVAWHFTGRRVVDGKEQEPHVDQKAVRVKRASKK